jgi:hypothetical protein
MAQPIPDPAGHAASDVKAGLRQAIRRSAAGRAPLHRQRRVVQRQAALLRLIIKEMPMRYTILVSRVQTAARTVRAASEDEARKKIEDELARP